MTVSKIEAFDNYCASNAGLVDSSAAMNRRSFLNRMALAMGALYIPVLSGCG
jgi:hypothetical protein